jgi:hypothetical protein
MSSLTKVRRRYRPGQRDNPAKNKVAYADEVTLNQNRAKTVRSGRKRKA